METLSFTFGMLTVIIVALIIIVAVGMIKVIKMQKSINTMDRWINEGHANMHNSIRGVETDLSRLINDDRQEFSRRIDDTYRYIDSRIDRLETKLNERYESARKVLETTKGIIND